MDLNVFLVLGTYYLLYLPPVVTNSVKVLWRKYGIHVFAVMMSCNGTASPLIYVRQSETFRRQIGIMYGLKKEDTPAQSTVSTII